MNAINANRKYKNKEESLLNTVNLRDSAQKFQGDERQLNYRVYICNLGSSNSFFTIKCDKKLLNCIFLLIEGKTFCFINAFILLLLLHKWSYGYQRGFYKPNIQRCDNNNGFIHGRDYSIINDGYTEQNATLTLNN